MKNLLGSEKSPYLLQHAKNPVWWYPWGPGAFEAAKKSDKPIFLSVGYSTCHWCHVMEKDSFEKKEVADVLNKNFIAIKVDREERPDVDSVYMNTVQAMTGGGGWPMSVLMDSDGRPFWGGTFLPQEQFVSVLNKTAELWAGERKELSDLSAQISDLLKKNADLAPGNFQGAQEDALNGFFNGFRHDYDDVNGGKYGAPKFPPALALMMLLRIHRRTNDESALAMAEHTLKAMRRGGIYDQIGGGFHRYSVDASWLVPHFEKMLYDNALLSLAYVEAFQLTKNEEYARTARETFDYVLKDLTSPLGGFYSAEDADSEDVEGKFYVWTEDELAEILTPSELAEVQKTLKVKKDHPNFSVHKTGDEFKEDQGPPVLIGHVLSLDSKAPLPDPKNKTFQAAVEKLRKTRAKRVRPHLDDKILTSWNALMISSLARGGRALGETKYVEAAAKAAEFLLKKMTVKDAKKNPKLARAFRDGEARHSALAEDYAFFIAALLDLYEMTFDVRWYDEASRLQQKQTDLFWDRGKAAFFDNDGSDSYLISRAKTYEDGVIPSANSVSAHNLLRFYGFTGLEDCRSQALDILQAASLLLEKFPQGVSKMLQCVDFLTDRFQEVGVVALSEGKGEAEKFIAEIHRGFFPNLVLAAQISKTGDNSIPLLSSRVADTKNPFAVYVCENQSCKAPVHSSAEALAIIGNPKKFEIELRG